MAEHLTEADVRRLAENPKASSRTAAARKIAIQYSDGTLNGRERQIAEEIFRLMVRDAEIRVREALSNHLKDSPDLAHDLARALADDVESVSLPMIRHSTVLTDADLIEIIAAQDHLKQQAVASRDTVSSSVADALVDRGDESVVATLVGNPRAKISEAAMEKVLDAFGDRPSVNEPLAKRAKLPVSIAERLVHLVSEQLQVRLIDHHKISDTTATDTVLKIRERAILQLAGDDRGNLEDLVEHLHANKRLTPLLIMRALFTGDMAFVEAALAHLAGIPTFNASVLIADGGQLGLDALLQKARIPRSLHKAVRICVDVCHETDYDGGQDDRERFCRRVIERILTHFEGSDAITAMGEDNVEYLLARLH